MTSCPVPKPHEVDLVIYHGHCMDGFGAAFAAWHFLGDKAQYVAMQHGLPAPDVEGRNVAIVDFSFNLEIMKALMTKVW